MKTAHFLSAASYQVHICVSHRLIWTSGFLASRFQIHSSPWLQSLICLHTAGGKNVTNARLINSSVWLKMNSFNVYFFTHASLRLIVLWQMSFNIITSPFMHWGEAFVWVCYPFRLFFGLWLASVKCSSLTHAVQISVMGQSQRECWMGSVKVINWLQVVRAISTV